MTAFRLLGSTYRLQLNAIGFAGAAAVVPFLADLGVQTCYVSPVTRARSGSTHGYDVVDPTQLDPELGTPADLDELLVALDDHDMTLLIDIVPNHMAASVENPFFADVLTHGRGSPFAAYFDIAWDEQDGKVMLPVLGGPLAGVLGSGELSVSRDQVSGLPVVKYFEHRFPLDPATCEDAVGRGLSTELLDRQHYLLCDWRLANQQLNYRRFFDINELIGVRQEDPEVFQATHQLVRELCADRRVCGLRVDHVDGLRDPGGYLSALQAAVSGDGPVPVIEVEKILERDEQLPDWPIEGTTGYDFAVAVTGLFVDPDGARRIADATAQATGDGRSFAERGLEAKRQVLTTLFAHQLRQVASRVSGVVDNESDDLPTPRDEDVLAAVAELTAQLSVYRTYRQPGEPVTDADKREIESAAARARPQLADGQELALDQAVELMCGAIDPATAAADAVASWQQLTSPATAKGVEDTALYNPGGCLASADVGGDPDRAAVSVEELHVFFAERRQSTPLALSTLSTHDSKRSHDVRCRLAVLTEIPDRWESAVAALEAARPDAQGPDEAERRYLYETIVGAWPLDGTVTDSFAGRIDEHVIKAAREAKRHTSWTSPDAAYESGLRRFAGELLTGADGERRDVIAQIVSSVDVAGATNSLASVAIRAIAPGVPDVYQGDDLWFYRLVDPDNRPPFDAAAHAASLLDLPTAGIDSSRIEQIGGLLGSWRDGRVKQFVVRQSLHARRRLRGMLEVASYQPLEVRGPHRDRVFAFARVTEDRMVMCIVPRLAHSLAGSGEFPLGPGRWSDTVVVLPAGPVATCRDVITGATVDAPEGVASVASIFDVLPLGLLESE